ncbi:MAG: PD-(D/E)XK nuclease family transposase, partial [Myxococcota bacterium]
FVDQLGKGEDYTELREVTLLSILDFSFLASKNYLSDHMIIDPVTGEHRLKDLGFTFLQLPEFLKKEEELVTLEEKWVYFFKHARETPVGRIPATLRAVPEIEEAFAVLEEIGLDRHELELYRKADMARRDRASQLETSYDKGRKKGLAEGEKKGLKKGREEGREEGLAEGEKKGEHRKAVEIARAMRSLGVDVDVIARATGLSGGDVKPLD